MKKPDYKGAVRDLMALLETIPEQKGSTHKTKIKDVTNEYLGTSYQFSNNDLTIFRDKSDQNKSNNNHNKTIGD
jgi:hypothetical protein